MLSDEEFLAELLPKLRAKRAAQGRTGDSSHDSSAPPSSPKNGPNAQGRTPGDVRWFPVQVSAMSKYGDERTSEVTGVAEALSAPLSSNVDGIIKLEHPYQNLDAERVTLLSVERLRLKGQKVIRGQSVRTEKDVVRVSMRGVDSQPARLYEMDLPAMSHDHKTNLFIRGWEERAAARNQDWQERAKVLEEQATKLIEKHEPRMHITISDFVRSELTRELDDAGMAELRRKLLGPGKGNGKS